MNPSSLTADDFPAFFRELWGSAYEPFPWQGEFARRLCAGQVPDYVAVPTGSGKTASLDAAVFALAVQAGVPMAGRTQGRRIFFIVNRRVIVDEAYDRAGTLCQKLRIAPPESVVGRVAAVLRQLSGDPDATPLMRAQLRGGIYRDRSWASSLLQPMIVCSTVDQTGSRLLFRGYGVSPQARPIHAALVAQDSLLIIDEAHISRPFIQTLEWVKRYLNFWKGQMMQPGDQPPVGLLLCTDKDQTKVEYATGGLDHQLFVSRYLVALPKPEELERLIETDRAVWEQHHGHPEDRASRPSP